MKNRTVTKYYYVSRLQLLGLLKLIMKNVCVGGKSCQLFFPLIYARFKKYCWCAYSISAELKDFVGTIIFQFRNTNHVINNMDTWPSKNKKNGWKSRIKMSHLSSKNAYLWRKWILLWIYVIWINKGKKSWEQKPVTYNPQQAQSKWDFFLLFLLS